METHLTCTAEGSGTSTPPSGQPRGGFTRSCTTCRSRKVKCDKQQPCAQCVRSGVDCVYPPGPGRAPKRPRKERDVQLLNRLSRLETIIKALDKDNNSRSNPPRESAEGTDHVRVQDRTGSESEQSRSESPIDKQLGRLMIADSRSYYVSSVLWANLSDEIEELRDLLHQPTSDDETPTSTKSPAADSSSLEIGSNAMLLGFRSLAQSLNEFHPQISISVALLEVFKQNVAPLVRIFHIPTLIKLYWDAVSSLDSPDKNTEALLFTIYYSAIISMDSEQCVSILGVDRPTALERYLFATQQALARADLLNTENLVLLQAAVLFLSALRNEDDSRRVWSLTALVYHIAQAMGLHRDGPAFGLGPFETELRRRLWWHICLLDNRSSDYHGCEPIVHESLFDTKIPLNINDSDITPEMTEPPPEREGATEMTFCLIRFHSMRVMWKIGNIPPSKEAASDQRLDGQKHALTLEDCEALVDGLNQKLQDQFIRHCDLSIPFYLVSVTVARLIIARSWLMVHYPRSRKDCLEAISSETLRDKLFLTSVQVLEMSSFLMTNKDLRRWRWHSQTHFQWHALAFVLLEICRRPPSPDCDRAWAYVSTVYSQWNMRESHKKYAFWRPVQRLMAKAQYVREIQSSTMASLASYSQTADGQSQAQPSGLNATLWAGSIQDPGAADTGNALQPPADGDSVLPGANPFSGDGKDQSLYSLMELDSLIDMFPETEAQNFASLTGQDGVFGSV